MPLREYIQHLYFKRFGREYPDVVESIEEKVRLDQEKKALRREAKLLRRQAEIAESKGSEVPGLNLDVDSKQALGH